MVVILLDGVFILDLVLDDLLLVVVVCFFVTHLKKFEFCFKL